MFRKPFKIQLINTRTLQRDSRKLELQRHIRQHDPDVLLITETSLKSRHKMTIQKYDIIRNDRNGQRGGGTAIIYRENFLHEDLFMSIKPTSFEYSAIILNNENNEKMIIVVCIYIIQSNQFLFNNKY